MLLLRRKFFYSDQNVDSRDPVQLNLLYVQVGKSPAPRSSLFSYRSERCVSMLCCAFERVDVLLFGFLPGQGRHSEWIPSRLL